MPDYIVKAKIDEDFYLRYSTVVDSPTHFGTRDEMITMLGREAAERLDRADATGSSALWSFPPIFGWDHDRFLIRECVVDATRPDGAWWGYVERSDLRKLCETLGDDGNFHPPAGMVTWSNPDSGDPS